MTRARNFVPRDTLSVFACVRFLLSYADIPALKVGSLPILEQAAKHSKMSEKRRNAFRRKKRSLNMGSSEEQQPEECEGLGSLQEQQPEECEGMLPYVQ